MRSLDGDVLYSPTDLAAHLACEHRLTLDLAAARGDIPRPDAPDASAQMLFRRGLDHENAFLDRLRAEGRTVVEIERPGPSREDLMAGEARTLAAMRSGAEVIYQAAFYSGRAVGYADFLLRVEVPSALGTWSYEVADTKLARTAKESALMQLAWYAEQIERLQHLRPAHVAVVVSDGTIERIALADIWDAYTALRERVERAVRSREPAATEPWTRGACATCRWRPHCVEDIAARDSLSLVTGIRASQRDRLHASGVRTLSDLAGLDDSAAVEDLPPATLDKLRRQARLQLRRRADGMPRYELLAPDGSFARESRALFKGRAEAFVPNKGLTVLPPPSRGDVFFDIEGDPHALDGQGIDYLFGVTYLDARGRPEHRAFWAHDAAEEGMRVRELLAFIAERRRRWPDLHVYHYAAYERTSLRRLTARHGLAAEGIESLITESFVDLYPAVRQGLMISESAYSLKKIEALYAGKRAAALTSGNDSIAYYERYLETRDAAILRDIEAYNRTDCLSVLQLRDWLEERRRELEVLLDITLPRPVMSLAAAA